MGALRAGFVEHNPDHGRHFAFFHAVAKTQSAGEGVFQIAAESVSPIDGGVAFFGMLGVTGGQDDPRLEVDGVTPEAGEERALELFKLGYAGGYLGSGFGEGGGAGGILCGVLCELQCGFTFAGSPVWKIEDGTDPVLWAAAAVVVGVVDVEDGLDFVVAGGDGGEGCGECDAFGVRVDFQGRARVEVLDFPGSDPGRCWMKFVCAHFVVSGAGLEEDEEASANRRGKGGRCMHDEVHVAMIGRGLCECWKSMESRKKEGCVCGEAKLRHSVSSALKFRGNDSRRFPRSRRSRRQVEMAILRTQVWRS